MRLIFKKILFIFRERGREGEREGEKHQCVVDSRVPPPGDQAHNPGMCPDWEPNWQPFGSQASAQSTEPHQPGQWEVLLTQPALSAVHQFPIFTLKEVSSVYTALGRLGASHWKAVLIVVPIYRTLLMGQARSIHIIYAASHWIPIITLGHKYCYCPCFPGEKTETQEGVNILFTELVNDRNWMGTQRALL